MSGLIPLLAAPLAFGLVAALTPAVIALARWRGWVARPSADRWHQKPTLMRGGIAIYVSASVAVLLLSPTRVAPTFAAAASLMFLAGLVDDWRKISPAIKIVAQLAAAALFVSSGNLFNLAASPWLTVPLTLFWLLGITNGLNLIDNMDGLAGGVSAIAALALGAMALIARATPLAVCAFAVAGAAAGFLLYNFKPARIFMGDCGSLFLGFTLAALAVMVQNSLEVRGLLALFMTAMILGVPILDTTLVTVLRTLHDRPVSQGGRDHTSHRLVKLGLSEKQAVLLLYAIAAGFGVLAVVFYLSDVRLRVSVLIFAALAAGLWGAELGAENVYTGAGGHKPPSGLLARLLILPRAVFGKQWKPAFAVLVDAAILVASFVLAHYLRFEDGLTSARRVFLVRSLPLIVLARLPLFALFGLYRAVWRQAGALDILRIVAAVTVGAAAAYLGLGVLHGFPAVSRGVLVIDWMAVILSLVMTRFGFRWLRSHLISLSRRGVPVAVYGAGEDGALTLRCLRRFSREFGLRPVAIIDEEETERGHALRGLRVLGGLEQLPLVKEKYAVRELILPTNHVDAGTRRRIEAACRKEGLRCRTLFISLRSTKKALP